MSNDEITDTQDARRQMVFEVNRQIESDGEVAERTRLELEHGEVWDTQRLSAEFEVLGFLAPFVVVRRKLDGCKSSLMFQHSPRLYFRFLADA
jgi:hypothetical protein